MANKKGVSSKTHTQQQLNDYANIKPTRQTRRLLSQIARTVRNMILVFLMVRVMVGATTNFLLLLAAAQAANKG